MRGPVSYDCSSPSAVVGYLRKLMTSTSQMQTLRFQCVRVCVRTCMCARACHVCVHLRVCACVYACVSASAHVCARVIDNDGYHTHTQAIMNTNIYLTFCVEVCDRLCVSVLHDVFKCLTCCV